MSIFTVKTFTGGMTSVLPVCLFLLLVSELYYWHPSWVLCPMKQTCLLYIPVVTHMDACRQAAWTARGLVLDTKQLSSFECFLCERLLERWYIPDALGYMGFESGLCHNYRPAHWRLTTENGWQYGTVLSKQSTQCSSMDPFLYFINLL